jgi:hypothetical protein
MMEMFWVCKVLPSLESAISSIGLMEGFFPGLMMQDDQ